MKFSFFTFFLLIFIFNSCSSEDEKKFEAYNAEAFAYDLGDSWEVNATTRVKGFAQNQNKENYFASFAYDIDLITAKGDTIKSLISRTEDKSKGEKIMDTDLEVQFDLDSTYAPGKYKIIFHVKDVLSNQTASTSAEFELKE